MKRTYIGFRPFRPYDPEIRTLTWAVEDRHMHAELSLTGGGFVPGDPLSGFGLEVACSVVIAVWASSGHAVLETQCIFSG